MDSRVYGEDEFLGRALQQAEQELWQRPDLKHVLQVVREQFRVGDEELRKAGQGVHISEIRALLAWAVLELSDASLKELGQWLGRDTTSLSSAVKRLEEKAKKVPEVSVKMLLLRELLSKFATSQA